MAGFASAVGLVAMLEALVHTHGRRAMFLGIAVLVTVIAADSPVADKSLLDSTHHPMDLLGNKSPTGPSPSALTDSHYAALESQDSPVALSSVRKPSREASTANTKLFERGHISYESTVVKRETLSEELYIPTASTLGESEPPQFQTPAESATDWKIVKTNSDQSSSPIPTASQSNTPITPFDHSAGTGPTLQQGTNSTQKDIFSKQQGEALEQPLTITTLEPSKPLDQAFADESYSKVVDVNHLSPSGNPLKVDKPTHAIGVLHNANEILSPSYSVPFIAHPPASPSSQPTEVALEDFYPTNTMEVDWGSGDYLETMSFFDSDRDEFSLFTKVPSDSYDTEDYTETYDTSFPSRVGISLSSLQPLIASPSPSFVTASSSSTVQLKSVHPSSFYSTDQISIEPTSATISDMPDLSDIDWPDTFTIHPTDVLLPDMNSLEYYTTQLTKENNSSETAAEHRGNVSVVSISTTDVTPSNGFINESKFTEDESSGDISGFQPNDETTTMGTTVESPHLVNSSEPFLEPSIVPVLHPSSSVWGGQVSTTDWFAHSPTVGLDGAVLTETVQHSATPLLPDDFTSSSSLTDVHWFVTEAIPESTTIHTTAVLTATIAFSPVPTEPAATAPQDSAFTTEQPLNVTSVSTEPASQNATVFPPVELSDQGVTDNGVDSLATVTLVPSSSEVNTVSAAPTSTTATTAPPQATTGMTATTEASISVNIVPTTTSGKTTTSAPTRQYLCNVDRPDYVIKIGFPSGATVGYAKTQIRDILKVEFNKSVELQVVDPPPRFVFRVVSGPVLYTAISVINALRRSGRRFLSLSPSWTTPNTKYQVHTVLQFVPRHIDVRYCNFSESIEKGLTKAFAEVRRRSRESTNFTVHIVNITMAASKYEEQRPVKQPVDITFTVRGSRGYLMGSEVSNALIRLTMVEFSYYMGFPVLQIAEPFHYPELNTSHLLRSSWVRTVLLGVLDEKVGERTFQANMERRLAMLVGEAMGLVRRVKRATTVGNNSVQVVSADRLVDADHPLQIVYFVEGPSGRRMPAAQTADLLNRMDVQRAAIVLGYRVQGILAQPVEKVASSPSDTENTNMWIVIGVVVPLLVVVVIISILYWKLCRTDKLEFQPDAMTSIQQRQKLQAPSVKGFDFAKLHLGQQSKDDVMVIQESVLPGPGTGPHPVSIKDGLSPSENGEIPTPVSKTSASSTKASRSGRRRERISPSDGDSVVSDHSSERESTEENLRVHATPSDSKQTRKVPINVLNGKWPRQHHRATFLQRKCEGKVEGKLKGLG